MVGNPGTQEDHGQAARYDLRHGSGDVKTGLISLIDCRDGKGLDVIVGRVDGGCRCHGEVRLGFGCGQGF